MCTVCVNSVGPTCVRPRRTRTPPLDTHAFLPAVRGSARAVVVAVQCELPRDRFVRNKVMLRGQFQRRHAMIIHE